MDRALRGCYPAPSAMRPDHSLTILPETAKDAQAIERLHERTFGPGRFALSAYRLREHVDHLLDLSFTARIGTLLVGSVRQLPITIGDTPALMLGPLTVEPPFRGRGVGRALLERALKDARARAIAWWCWSATNPITAASASSRSRRGGRSCLARSIPTACWWRSSSRGLRRRVRRDPAGLEQGAVGASGWAKAHLRRAHHPHPASMAGTLTLCPPYMSTFLA